MREIAPKAEVPSSGWWLIHQTSITTKVYFYRIGIDTGRLFFQLSIDQLYHLTEDQAAALATVSLPDGLVWHRGADPCTR